MNGKTYLVFSFGNFHSILNVFSLVSINTYGEWLDVLVIGVVVSLAYILVLTPKNCTSEWELSFGQWETAHTHTRTPFTMRATTNNVRCHYPNCRNTQRNWTHANVVVNKKIIGKVRSWTSERMLWSRSRHAGSGNRNILCWGNKFRFEDNFQ